MRTLEASLAKVLAMAPDIKISYWASHVFDEERYVSHLWWRPMPPNLTLHEEEEDEDYTWRPAIPPELGLETIWEEEEMEEFEE